MNNITKEFQQVQGIINLHRSRALQTVNNENLLTAWQIGAFVSARLKNSAWGSKTVMQLSEYLRTQDPSLRGYSRRNIYNMVSLYDTYSSGEFVEYTERLKLNSFAKPLQESQIVQPKTAQIQKAEIVQSVTAQIENIEIVQPVVGQIVLAVPTQIQEEEIVQTSSGQFVQPVAAQTPNFLNLTTLSNHFEILNACKTIEERIFYVLYSHNQKIT